MTITMTSKNQVTIPKKIVDALDLGKGAMFEVTVANHRIELIPVEIIEKVYTSQEYSKMEQIFQKEKGKTKKMTNKVIENLKKGEI